MVYICARATHSIHNKILSYIYIRTHAYTIARRVIIAEARSVGDFGMNWQRIRCISRRETRSHDKIVCVCVAPRSKVSVVTNLFTGCIIYGKIVSALKWTPLMRLHIKLF